MSIFVTSFDLFVDTCVAGMEKINFKWFMNLRKKKNHVTLLTYNFLIGSHEIFYKIAYNIQDFLYLDFEINTSATPSPLFHLAFRMLINDR